MANQNEIIRRKLINALKQHGEKFDLSQFVTDNEFTYRQVEEVSEKLVFQLFVRSTSDGIITDKENDKLQRLTQLLRLSKHTCESVFERSAWIVFRNKRCDLICERADQPDYFSQTAFQRRRGKAPIRLFDIRTRRDH